jgi:UDP-2,3-diacylglucosamine hydrolase
MVLFVSDLHLCESRPQINQVFFEFLRGPARAAESLYILGDLFEYWAGDDDLDDPFNASVVSKLAELSRAGITVNIMHGNRDFLFGEAFAEACGARLISDPCVAQLGGISTLLLHGDTLCTDDTEYQRFRAEVRTLDWRQGFLSLPLAQRKQQIAAMRERSELEKQRKVPAVMDVNRGAVEQVLRDHGYPRLIHGHTHRPAHHEFLLDGRRCERWVLADWYRSGSFLRCDAHGCAAVQVS